MAADQPDPHGTRREPAATGAGIPDDPPPPHLTRREGWAGGDPEDPGRTRREDPAAAGEAGSIIILPPALRPRYSVVEDLPNPGTEADVLLVRDHEAQAAGSSDPLRVVKVYRLGMTAEHAVWAKVQSLRSPHVVRIFETGTSAGRDYEVMEYLPDGNLTSLAPRPGAPVPLGIVTEVIRQVTDGLAELHQQGIVHRDLKPENVLIRRRERLEVAVTDFGLSRVHDQSMVAASRSGTLAYLAPEILLPTGARSSKARDWWALGMIARELLTGTRPFDQMTAPGVESAVLLRGMDLGDIDDPRARLLCAGLLVKDPADRWGVEQVRDWVAGGTPAVVDETSGAVGGIEPFTFERTAYREKKSLARALARSWERAARRYFAAMGSAASPSSAWLALRTWLEQFSDEQADDVESLHELVGEHLQAADIPPDVKLLALIQWLDPNLEAVYRGVSVSRHDLPALAARAADDSGPEQAAAARIVQDLFQHQLLPRLAGMRGTDGFGDLDLAWRELDGRYTPRVTALRAGLPAPAWEAATATGWRLAMLLGLALGAMPGEQLRTDLHSGAAALPAPVPWFDNFRESAAGRTDPVDDIILLALFPVAARAAATALQASEQQEAARHGREMAWAERESRRLAGGGLTPVAWAYLGVGVLALLVLLYVEPYRGVLFNTVEILVGLGAGTFLVWSEMDLAKHLGADYADFAPLARAGQVLRRAGGQVRGPGAGCLVLIVVVVAIVVAVNVPFVAFGALAGGHWASLASRRRSWQQRHNEARRQALEV